MCSVPNMLKHKGAYRPSDPNHSRYKHAHLSSGEVVNHSRSQSWAGAEISTWDSMG